MSAEQRNEANLFDKPQTGQGVSPQVVTSRSQGQPEDKARQDSLAKRNVSQNMGLPYRSSITDKTGKVTTTTTVTKSTSKNAPPVGQPQVTTNTRTVVMPDGTTKVIKETVTVKTEQRAVETQPLLSQPKQATQSDYQFYDGGVVPESQPQYQLNPSHAQAGLIAGVFGLLAALALVVLAAVIFHRSQSCTCYGSIPLVFLIFACIAVVVAVFGIWACLGAKGEIDNGGEPNQLFIVIAQIAALMLFAFFLAAAVYMFMYRPFHYGDVVLSRGTQEDWYRKYGQDWSFEDAWGQDRKVIWWIALLCVASAVAFLVLAICLWLLCKFPVQLARIILGSACLGGALFGLLSLTYYWQAKTFFTSNFSVRFFNFGYVTTLIVMLAVGVGLLFLNCVWNLLKKRVGHFFFSIVLILFVFVFVCFLGLLLREQRHSQFESIKSSNLRCRDFINNFSSADIEGPCPQKYLPEGSQCSKDFLAQRWEGDQSLQSINPACCQSVSNSVLCPLFFAAIFGLLFAIAILVAIAANFYLSDTSEYLEFSDKAFSVWELLFVIACLIVIICFGIYWGFSSYKNGQIKAPSTTAPGCKAETLGNSIIPV